VQAQTGGAALVALAPIAVTTSTILFASGVAFLHGGGIPVARWLWLWVSYCALTAVHQVFLLAITFVEGTGRRDIARRTNFRIEVAAGLAFLCLIALRQELWALPVGRLVRAVVISALFGGKLRGSKVWSAKSIRRSLLLWRDQLWPMQWKTLLNNLTGC
jgi:hypothetical protein